MRLVQQGDRVEIHYVKRFQGGPEVSPGGKSHAELTVGVAHPRLPGLELALVGLAQGECRTLRVPARRAYGPYDASRLYRLPRTRFVEHTDLSVGKWVRIWDRRGHRRLVRIVELRDNVVVVDANHRRAGQFLELDVEVIAIHGPQGTSAADGGAERPAPDLQRDLREDGWRDDGGQN
jgi:FKBP-type peptidyl-prolyl cis-trans isomerase 2